jgi:putative hydrolase of the HAD superfamily
MKQHRESPDETGTVLFFDLDDTLVVERASAEEAFLAAAQLAQERYNIDPALLSQQVRIRARELWHELPTYPYCVEIGISSWEGLWGDFTGEHEMLGELNRLADRYRLDSWHRALRDSDIDDREFALELSQRFIAERRKRHIPFPETAAVLTELAASSRLGLITNGAPAIQREKIQGSGVGHFFEDIIISGEVNAGKPEREIFRIAMNRFNAEPAACAIVGDSINRDIAGGQQAGMRTIWINRDGKKLDTYQPDHIISSLTEIPELLRVHLR